MAIRELDDVEFKSTLTRSMRKLAIGDIPPVRLDLRDDVAAAVAAKNISLPPAELTIAHVYVSDGDKHTHVSFYFGRPNTYLVIIVDNIAARVLGFHLLDIGKLYGLD